MEKQKFYSNGKLLITGEYIVLDGAKALALPTKFGQTLEVFQGNPGFLEWISYDVDGNIWFEDVITFEEIIKREIAEKESIKGKLIGILHYASLKNDVFLDSRFGYKIITKLTFNKNWGLGTSSTLINNLAQWLQIDSYELLRNTFGGSGYDIACAQNNQSLTYQLVKGKPIVELVNFNPVYKEKIYFLYLNKKQNSQTQVANYIAKQHRVDKEVFKINEITEKVLISQSGGEFALLMEKHEAIMSEILEMQTVKENFFSDFKGVVKSLGAWGGDFVMVLSKECPRKYFREKGYDVILTYDEMIL